MQGKQWEVKNNLSCSQVVAVLVSNPELLEGHGEGLPGEVRNVNNPWKKAIATLFGVGILNSSTIICKEGLDIT